MLHGMLILKAIDWLRKPYKNCVEYGHNGCSVIITELHTQCIEIPDALGFCRGKTVLIEAKTSMSDFYADMKKPFRENLYLGVGDLRYYICESGLIPENKLPEKWGLLYVNSVGKVALIREAEMMKEKNFRAEQIMLLSYIRRTKNK
jgi:hypothetical protein